MENIRKDLAVLGLAFQRYDDTIEALAEARWKFEMLRRNPEMGIRADPKTKQIEKITADQIRPELEQLEKQTEFTGNVVKHLFNTTDIDIARELYAELLSAYQEVGRLRGSKVNAIITDSDSVEGIETDLTKAREILANTHQRIGVPAVSNIASSIGAVGEVVRKPELIVG